MSVSGDILSHEALSFLCNCINNTVNLSKDIVLDTAIQTSSTYSSYLIENKLKQLKEENETYANSLVAGLNKLSKEVINDKSLITQENILYLYKSDTDTSNNYMQMMLINGVSVELGTTEVDLSTIYSKQECDSKFGAKLDLDTLTTSFNDLKAKIGDTSQFTDTLVEEIIALKNKSDMVTLTQAEYNQLVADGTIDNDTYYIISDDSENIEITQSISSSSTENEVPSAKAVYDKTKNMCTTTVADVGKTNITSRVSNATVNAGGGIYYSIKNGICYVQIHSVVTTVASTGQKILSDDSLPIPDYNLTNGHYAIVSPQSTNGLIVLNENGAVYYYGGEMTIFTSISYPVIES